MKTLIQHNIDVRKETHKPVFPAGVLCNDCGNQMEYMGSPPYTDNSPYVAKEGNAYRVNVVCDACGYRGGKLMTKKEFQRITK